MCGPIALAAGGAAMSLAGSAAQFKGQSEAADAALAQARANAKLAQEAAADAEKRGMDDASRLRGQGDALISAQRVRYAASGVDVTTGTAAEVMAQTRELVTMDEQVLINNAAREAFGLRVHGMQFLAGAAIGQRNSEAEQTGTVLGAIGKGMNSGADIYASGVKAKAW